MIDPSKEPMGQGSVLVTGLVLLWIGTKSLWASWQSGTYVFIYINDVIHTGRFAQALIILFMVLGYYLASSSWRRIRSNEEGA